MPLDAGYTKNTRGALSLIEFFFEDTQSILKGQHPEKEYEKAVEFLAKYTPDKIVKSYEHSYKLDTGAVHERDISFKIIQTITLFLPVVWMMF